MPASIKDIKKAMRHQAETANMSHQMRQRILSVPNLNDTTSQTLAPQTLAPQTRVPHTRVSRMRVPQMRMPHMPQMSVPQRMAASLVIGVFVTSFFMVNSPSSTRQAWVFSPSAFDENSLDPSSVFTTNYTIE